MSKKNYLERDGKREISPTGSRCPLGLRTITSTEPLPAEEASIVNLAGIPTLFPRGSRPKDKYIIDISKKKFYSQAGVVQLPIRSL